MNLAVAAYELLVRDPLRHLYLHGPDFKTFGGWGGKDNDMICAIMTDTSPGVWRSQPEACDDLINRRFVSFAILLETTVYLLFLLRLIYCVAANMSSVLLRRLHAAAPEDSDKLCDAIHKLAANLADGSKKL